MIEKFLFFLLPVSYSNPSCSIFVCDNWVTDTCVYKSDNILVHTNCSYPDTYCPDFSIYSNETIYCLPLDNTTELDSNYSTQCIDYKSSGQKLTPGSYCSPGLIVGKDDKCKAGPKLGEKCSDLCNKGLVCNYGKCVEYFSIEPGKNANNSLACQSGILENEVCQNKSESLTIPMQCTSDIDCIDTLVMKQSECICTMNDPAISYCALHASDSMVIEAKKASSDRDILLARKLWHEVNNYPILQYSNPCMYSHSVQHKKLTQYERELQECWSIILGVTFFLILGI